MHKIKLFIALLVESIGTIIMFSWMNNRALTIALTDVKMAVFFATTISMFFGIALTGITIIVIDKYRK